jgi:threonylcarbamoyladenosine tRNA methylthiotransferase MtaB
LEPQLITQEIISSLQHGKKFCPHLHIALQSGCDSVLGRMGRHYDTKQIRDLVDKLSSSIPSIALGFDVIVGFPGESLEEFEQTRMFLDALPIAYLHVFSYSRRKNTVAASLPNQVSAAEKSKRAAILAALSKRKKELYVRRLINDQVGLRGICEAHKDGYTTMLTDHYLRAYLPGELALGSLARCVPTNTHLDGVLGQVED